MPRPRLTDGEKRTERINLTLTPPEMALVVAAKLGAESVSQTARRLMLHAARYTPQARILPSPSTTEPDA